MGRGNWAYGWSPFRVGEGENLHNYSVVRLIVTHILAAVRKMVPFNAQNDPMYEMGSIVMLFYTR